MCAVFTLLVPPLPAPPHEIRNAKNEIAVAARTTEKTRLPRTLNGLPSTIAANDRRPQDCQGKPSGRIEAFAVAGVTVSTELAFPPVARVAGGALATIFAAVPSFGMTLVVNDTVPE